MEGMLECRAHIPKLYVVGELGWAVPAELGLMVKMSKLRIFPHSEPPNITSPLLDLFSLGFRELILLKNYSRVAGHPISPPFQGDAPGRREKEARPFSQRN